MPTVFPEPIVAPEGSYAESYDISKGIPVENQ